MLVAGVFLFVFGLCVCLCFGMVVVVSRASRCCVWGMMSRGRLGSGGEQSGRDIPTDQVRTPSQHRHKTCPIHVPSPTDTGRKTIEIKWLTPPPTEHTRAFVAGHSKAPFQGSCAATVAAARARARRVVEASRRAMGVGGCVGVGVLLEAVCVRGMRMIRSSDHGLASI
jgi:hypothetical protein